MATGNGPKWTRRALLRRGARAFAAAGMSAPIVQILAGTARAQSMPNSGLDRAARTIQRDNIEFAAVESLGSTEVTVVAQCLDNQWVPRGLLHRMIGEKVALNAVESKRAPYVRAEYIRALINAQRVVCNRAYLFNNPVVFNDYLRRESDREAFKELLGTGVLTAYLYNEASPLQKPQFSVHSGAFDAWQQICQETRMTCVRLSWDDDVNAKMCTERLAEPFHKYVLSAHRGSRERFARDLAIGRHAVDVFSRRLRQVSDKVAELQDKSGTLVTREQLYREFVTIGDPTQGQYDGNKPFAAPIKELIDLSYNTALPDALLGYTLTPRASITRTALQEIQLAPAQASLPANELLQLLKNTAFSLIEDAMHLASLRWLALTDVITVRKTDEWAQYMESVSSLLADPTVFPDSKKGAPAVYDRFAALAKKITMIAKDRLRGDFYERWMPRIEVEVDHIGGEVASLTWGQLDSPKPAYALHAGAIDLAARAAAGVTPFVVRLVVRGATEIAAQADLFWSIDVLRASLGGGIEEWEYIKAKLKENFPLSPSERRADRPTINFRVAA